MKTGPAVRARRDTTAQDGSPIRESERIRVEELRRRKRRWQLAMMLVGPGILTMVGENDGPSMISYAATGRAYGFGLFLPFILVTFAAAAVCQEACLRVGVATGRGFGELVAQRYGPLWGALAAGDLVVSNAVTLVAELVAVRVGFAYFGIGAPVAVGLGLAVLGLGLAGRRYRRWERRAL
ncbi:divalent metal cation transporter, partial [Acidimicrobiaceae bacterium USS-CC1]|nr:divalent metal cation transporter [Acidiferrimicrobium australe]